MAWVDGFWIFVASIIGCVLIVVFGWPKRKTKVKAVPLTNANIPGVISSNEFRPVLGRDENPFIKPQKMIELQAEYEAGKMTANQVRAELGYPPIGPSGDLYLKQDRPYCEEHASECEVEEEPKPHKHYFRYTGHVWVGTHGPKSKYGEFKMQFKCFGWMGAKCDEVRITRWKWNEMTRTMPKVDQVWPG